MVVRRASTGFRYASFPVTGTINDSHSHAFNIPFAIGSAPLNNSEQFSVPVDFQIISETSCSSVDVWLTKPRSEEFSYTAFPA